jgi:hypothetical protein
MAKVTETAMPEGGAGADCEREGPKDRRHEGVERPGTIAPDDHAPTPEVLHRETVWVKFNRTLIFNGELTNGNKILD